MNPKGSTTARRRRAAEALAGLGSHRSDHQRLSIQCRHAHHLAMVYETDAGLVYQSRTGPHGHGSKDFIDTGSHGRRGGDEYVDLLAAGTAADDQLPAWCDCGPRTLSRSELLGQARSGPHTVRLD
jgi:hypothetical protein